VLVVIVGFAIAAGPGIIPTNINGKANEANGLD